MSTIRRIEPIEWAAYKALRLQALRDSPDSFGSTVAAETARPDILWKDRLVAANSSGIDLPIFALVGTLPVGLAWAKVDATDPQIVNLFQMWVHPTHRGYGLGRSLLAESVAWSRTIGASSVCLGVTIADSTAWRLYSDFGFLPFGAPEALREGSSFRAQPMRLSLSANDA